MTPMSGRVICEIIKDKETSSGLFLPQNRKDDRLIKGKVIAIGEAYTSKSGKIWNTPTEVGDTVLLNKINIEVHKLNDKNICFPAFEDVVAVV